MLTFFDFFVPCLGQVRFVVVLDAKVTLISVDPFDSPAPVRVGNTQPHNLPLSRLFLPQLERLVNARARNVLPTG